MKKKKNKVFKCRRCHREMVPKEYTTSVVRGQCTWCDFIADKGTLTNLLINKNTHTGYTNMRKAYEGFMEAKIDRPLKALEIAVDSLSYYVWQSDYEAFIRERNGTIKKYIAIDTKRDMYWGQGGWRRSIIYVKVFSFYKQPATIKGVKWKKVPMCHFCSKILVEEDPEEHRLFCPREQL